MGQFRYFVVLAGMRTGSNFLEANLNQFDGLECLGELFNPTFVGHHNKTEAFGFDLKKREVDPIRLIEKLVDETDGLGGFRLFFDHDQRVLTHVLQDETCAKIVLTRDEVESYVSLKIATKTKQWRLSDLKQRRGAVVQFDSAEFEQFSIQRRAFLAEIDGTLKRSGQTSFRLDYEELGDVENLNGLARYLGSTDRIKATSTSLKRQNPGELKDKVSNYSVLSAYLSGRPDVTRDLAATEKERGALVKSYVACASAPLLFVPIPGGPDQNIRQWMAEIEDVEIGMLQSDFSQSSLWTWKKQNAPHRSFTVLRHPLERAHDAFCRVLNDGADERAREIRRVIRNRYGVPLPDLDKMESYNVDDHKAAVEGFLKFLKGNLAGQTSLGVDPRWASQTALLTGIGQVVIPDHVIRESQLVAHLDGLAQFCGKDTRTVPEEAQSQPFQLSDVEDTYLQKRAFDLYRKDYINFGFKKPV